MNFTFRLKRFPFSLNIYRAQILELVTMITLCLVLKLYIKIWKNEWSFNIAFNGYFLERCARSIYSLCTKRWMEPCSTIRILLTSWTSKPWFLNLGTIDIFNWAVPVVASCSVHCRKQHLWHQSPSYQKNYLSPRHDNHPRLRNTAPFPVLPVQHSAKCKGGLEDRREHKHKLSAFCPWE